MDIVRITKNYGLLGGWLTSILQMRNRPFKSYETTRTSYALHGEIYEMKSSAWTPEHPMIGV